MDTTHTFLLRRLSVAQRNAHLASCLPLVVGGIDRDRLVFFLPGVLDHFKFTDGLVGHSFVAMAGFTSSLLIFVMVQLLGDDGWIFNRSRSFVLWHGSVIAYVLLMTAAGWREGFDPAFTIVPSPERNLLYGLRLLVGVLMLLASLDWLVDCSSLLSESIPGAIPALKERTA